jgi:hypothetical protein
MHSSTILTRESAGVRRQRIFLLLAELSRYEADDNRVYSSRIEVKIYIYIYIERERERERYTGTGGFEST